MSKRFSLIDDWDLPQGVSALVSHNVPSVNCPKYGEFNLALYVGDCPKTVEANRCQLLQSQPSLQKIQWLNQTHSTRIVEACADNGTPDADASFSCTPGLAAAVLTADCLPVLFCNRQGTQVAAAHAGWRGLAQGILLNTLKQFDCAQEVSVYFGAAISVQAFAVGKEVREAFSWADDSCFEISKENQLYANLYALAQQQLKQAGVTGFYGQQDCTYAQEHYYSYRRQAITGRQVSMIWRHA